VPDRFRKTIVDLQAQADFWGVVFWFSQRRLDSDADGQQWLALPPKFPAPLFVTMLRSLAQSDSIDYRKTIVFFPV
jgi:hypothetical protein